MNDYEKKQHLNNFAHDGSALVSQQAYNDYMRRQDFVGRPIDGNDPQGSMFVAPKEEIDRVLKEANGDLAKVEKALGLPEGHFGDGPIIRVDIHDIHNQGLRVANGYESGANEYWNTKVDKQGNLPDIAYIRDADGKSTGVIDTTKTNTADLNKLNGQFWDEKGNYHKPIQDGYDGKTSTGINEGVINRVPNNAENVTYSELKGFARGESSNVTSTRIQDGYSPYNSAKNNIEKQGGPHPNAPPSHGGKSDLSDKNTMDKSGKNNTRNDSFTPVKPEDLDGREARPKESFSTFTEADLTKRNELKANQGTDSAAQASAVSSSLKGADNKKNNGTGLGA